MVNELDAVLPDSGVFCTLIEAHKHDEFITHQLLKLTSYLDTHDEHGRNTLIKQCRFLLKDNEFSEDLIPDVMKILRILFKNDEKDFVALIREDLDEIQDPVDENNENEENGLTEERINELEQKIIEIEELSKEIDDELEEAVQNRQYKKAQALQDEKDVLVQQYDDFHSVLHAKEIRERLIYLRSFAIIIDLLQYTKLSFSEPMIQSLESECIMGVWKTPLWKNDAEIRELGIKALGTYCMLDKEPALNRLWLFYNLSREDEEVSYVMLQTLLDFQFRYDFTDDELMNAGNPLNEDDGTLNITNQKLIEHIFSLFDSSTGEVLKVVVDGFCKLLITNRLKYKKKEVIARLLLLYFIPKEIDLPEEATEDEEAEADKLQQQHEHIKQILALFFPLYTKREENIKGGSRLIFLRSLVECIMAICTKPRTHEYHKIDVNTLIQYVVWLLEGGSEGNQSTYNNDPNRESLHSQLDIFGIE
eukprot:UN06827